MAKSKAEILQEFMDLYVADPSKRSYNFASGSCYYHDCGTGNRCAFGRYACVDMKVWEGSSIVYVASALAGTKAPDVSLDVPFAVYTNGTVTNTDFYVNNTTITDELLLPEYHGHTVRFWADLQGLHDTQQYWSESGLNERGRAALESFKEKWAIAL